MSRWTIYSATNEWMGGVNGCDTEVEAVAAWNARLDQPMEHVSYHEELEQRGLVANLHYEGEGRFRKLMCTYTPHRKAAASAQRMQEVWMDAGYCLVAA